MRTVQKPCSYNDATLQKGRIVYQVGTEEGKPHFSEASDIPIETRYEDIVREIANPPNIMTIISARCTGWL